MELNTNMPGHPIPKRIIQTGKSRQLPLLAQAASKNLQLLNPDYEYLFFDDADVEAFIDAHFPQHRPLFDSFPYRIQKYDFFRYLAIYHYGGFYFDLDIFMARGLNDLLKRGCVFPFEELSLHAFLHETYDMDWEVGNYAFGAAAGHPFIAAVIDNCVRAQREASWPAVMWRSIPRLFRQAFYVLDTTGPGLVSRTLAEFPQANSAVHVLFPADVCDEASWHQFGDYGVHLQDGGWRSRKSLWRRRLEAAWEMRVRAAVLSKAVVRGPRRALAFSRSA
jgi:inositol phosphorylceramide mannosyltransferase catalytic subunit